MKFRLFLLSAILILGISKSGFSQKIPLVYNVENTGADCARPVLPSYNNLPFIEPLPDPFEWSDGSARLINFDEWACRRAEIKAEIEHYEIGEKPDRPKDITASYSEGELTVNITVNGNTLSLKSAVDLPEGDGPFPAIIGIGRGSGSLPSDIFSERKIATISYNFSQVMAHTQTRGNEPINKLYPELIDMGAYSAWSWGVSRLIDGLELVADDLPIDLNHLAISGCSFAGKMALFAGTFDERIALTIAQEPGGGGAAAWRVSETLGNVETLGNTSHAWFMESMFQFKNTVPKLPYDHHELMAMVAPRALLVLGNPDYEWLADESGYVSCRAAHEVWKAFGIPDRFGFSIVAGHGHCRLPDSQKPEVEAFVEKFLLGNEDANTNVTTSPYENVDYLRWIEWWGTGNAVIPKRDSEPSESVFFEAECATVGSNWSFHHEEKASNQSYISAGNGNQNLTGPPTNDAGVVVIPLTIKSSGDYAVFARLNCPGADDDSFWVKMDDGEFKMFNGLGTNGWQWKMFSKFTLSAGEHRLTIGYREDGAKLDKIRISNSLTIPEGIGGDAVNVCDPKKDN